MRRTLTTLAFLIAGASAASAATDDELRTMLVGTWGQTAACAGMTLTFSDDGTFSAGKRGDDPAATRKGTYAIKDGKLSGEADGQAMPEVTLSVEGETIYFVAESGTKETVIRCK